MNYLNHFDKPFMLFQGYINIKMAVSHDVYNIALTYLCSGMLWIVSEYQVAHQII